MTTVCWVLILLSMRGRISYVNNSLGGLFSPILEKSHFHTSLNIFCGISISFAICLINKSFYFFNIVCKAHDSESTLTYIISISDKANSTFKLSIFFTLLLSLINNIIQRFFGSVNPHIHRSSAVTDKAKL